MKQIIIFSIAIAFSISASAQTSFKPTSVTNGRVEAVYKDGSKKVLNKGVTTSLTDSTALIKKQQEAVNKFVTELVQKTSIKDFQAWVYENIPAKANNEFNQMLTAFIQQKYYQSLQTKEQPKN